MARTKATLMKEAQRLKELLDAVINSKSGDPEIDALLDEYPVDIIERDDRVLVSIEQTPYAFNGDVNDLSHDFGHTSLKKRFEPISGIWCELDYSWCAALGIEQ